MPRALSVSPAEVIFWSAKSRNDLRIKSTCSILRSPRLGGVTVPSGLTLPNIVTVSPGAPVVLARVTVSVTSSKIKSVSSPFFSRAISALSWGLAFSACVYASCIALCCDFTRPPPNGALGP